MNSTEVWDAIDRLRTLVLEKTYGSDDLHPLGTRAPFEMRPVQAIR